MATAAPTKPRPPETGAPEGRSVEAGPEAGTVFAATAEAGTVFTRGAEPAEAKPAPGLHAGPDPWRRSAVPTRPTLWSSCFIVVSHCHPPIVFVEH